MFDKIDVEFLNVPQSDGTLKAFTVKGCVVGSTGGATSVRPQIIIHLPKGSTESVRGGWIKYDGDTYHIVVKTNSGATPRLMRNNTPGDFDRYVVAERIY